MGQTTIPPVQRDTAPQRDLGEAVIPVAEIRTQFPALTRQRDGQPVAYFDGPGGTQVPQGVVDAMVDYLCHHNANSHWNFPTSHETDQVIAAGRHALADFVGGQPDEIVFGPNSTSLAFHLSRALGPLFSAGDEIIVTELDHHANVAPWQALACEGGCVVRTARMDTDTFTFDWAHFEQLVNKRTKLVAVGAASNALGTITDVARACRLAKSVGAYAMVDAVHYAPHLVPDAAGWGCDFLMCSAYKFYGPHIGVLWCRRELLESLPFVKLEPAPNTAPDRAETGTQNHEGIAGAAAAVNFLEAVLKPSPTGRGQGEGTRVVEKPLTPALSQGERGKISDGLLASLAPGDSRRQHLSAALNGLHERSSALIQQLWSGLSQIDGVTLYGPPPETLRTATVAFTVRGHAPADVAGQLAERGLYLSHGNFYAATTINRLGLAPGGAVRAGCACYTTAEEIERLVNGVQVLATA